MPKVTVLLDVDETCVISNKFYGQDDAGYRYNHALFTALKACLCTEVYLFTSFNLTTVTQDESVGTASRLKLIQDLEEQGFKVLGVATPLDVVFKQGVGAYYEQVIKPYEIHVLNGESIRTGSAAIGYKAACEQEMQFIAQAAELKISMVDKGSLYQYLIELQRDTLLYPRFNVVFVDDRPAYLKDVEEVNQKYGYPLCLIHAKPQDTVAYYQKLISDFQYGFEVGDVTQQLERIKVLVLDKAQDEAYQTLQKEFKQISSATPDLLSLRKFSMKVAYFLTACEKLKALYANAESVALDNPLLQDKQAERLIAAIKAMPGIREISDTSQPEAILYGLDKPYSISLKTARDMLRKINKTGNSHVGRVGNVFFKQGAEFNLVEQAVYQLGRLFGEELVTPTRLLLLEIPGEDMYDIQASWGVGVDSGYDAIDLDALFQIPEAIAMLKQDLGEAQFVEDFSALLTNDYYQTWLHKRGFTEDMPWEKQCIVLLESLLKLREDHWPVGVKELYKKSEPQKSKLLGAALQEAFQDKKAPLRLLALLERYPILSKHHLNQLIIFSDVFECLKFLYPNLGAEGALKEIASLFNYIPKENLSAHLLLEILTEPEDHKGDNFKVQFKRNAQGNLMAPLEIIAIDNDAAMENVFKSKGKEHLLLVKSVLLANSMLLNEPIAESIRERCLMINPKVVIMQWLEALNNYYAPYYALKESGIILKGLARRLLDKQASVNFIGRLLERLERIQTSLKQEIITHRKLLTQVEPLLAYSYEALAEEHPSSQAMMTALYNKRKPVLLGNISTESVAQQHNGKTLSELIEALPVTKQGGYRSYIETLIEQVSNSLTANHPLQMHALTLCLRLQFYHITLPPEGLIISPAVFAEAYRQSPQKWVNLIKNCPKVSVQFQTLVLFSNPLILYHALSEREAPLLVNALLACGVVVNQVRLEDGLTPLHFAASFYPDSIPALIAAGAETESLDAQGQTPLEMAMRFNQSKAVILLLQAGAGRDLKAPLGLAFIKAYQKLCPELCQSLLSRNIAMAWYLALETVSQETTTPEAVLIMSAQGKRYLRTAVYEEIFKKGKKGHAFPKDNIHGVRSVTSIQCKIAEGIQAGLHLKEYPELPGREIMVHVLAKHLFGLITPSITLWRFSRTTKFLKKELAYPVLASRSIEGKNLFDVLEEDPRLKSLDKRSAYEAIVLAMMINPEDGRADNYIMQPFSQGQKTAYRIVSIDNDHAFVRPIALKKGGEELAGTKALQVKTILYCLEEMRDALPQDMVKRLLANNPYELLRNWLIELQQQQIEIDALFMEKEKKELLSAKDIHLDIFFKFSVVEDIYQKFCRLQTVLKENPRTPLLGILRVVIPELWIRYAGVFNQHDTALERFNVLTKDSFDIRIVKKEGKEHLYPGSTAQASQVLQMTRGLREEEKEEQEASAATALLRLDKLYAECSAIEEIAKELQQGVVERFKNLPSIHQEKIVNGDGVLPGLDFNAMLTLGRADARRQQTVLSALRRVSFRVLKIKNFSTLTDDQLSALLQKNKSLLALSLEGCTGLTSAALQMIENYCPNLEKLIINKLSWSRVNNLYLPHLRVLYVQECTQLLSWEIEAPSKIERLYFKNCLVLNKLSIDSTALRELELQYCPKLPESQLLKLAANTALLKKVELVECLAIANANFYQKYPKLINLPLQDFSSEFVERLDEGVALCLQNFGMPAVMIQSVMIEKLQENLILWQRFKRTLFFPALLKALEDTHQDVRSQVCQTLSKLPLTAEDRSDVLPALLKRLEDTFPEVRNCAVQALSKLLLLTDKDINAVLPILLKALRDKSKTLKNGVCEALPQLFLKPEDILALLPVLLMLLEDEYADVRGSAAQLLSKLPLRPENVATLLSALLKALEDENPEVRKHVCTVFSKLPLISENFIFLLSILLKRLTEKNKTTRSGACQALSKLPLTAENIPSVRPVLLRALQDADPDVRGYACEALSRLPLTSVEVAIVLPLLLQALTDTESEVRSHVCEALPNLSLTAEDKARVASALTTVLENENEYDYVRTSAEQALSKLSLRPEDVATVPESKTLRETEAETVQPRLLTAENKISRLPDLLVALGDKGRTLSVRSDAAQELLTLSLTIEDKILCVLPTLLNALADEYSEIRIQAVELLVSFYPLTQEIAEACCQKFKNATRVLVTQNAEAKATHEMAIVHSGYVAERERVLSFDMHSSPQQMQMVVSGQGNNCGLFALVLGLKKGLDHKPQLSNTTRLPNFFYSINVAWLRPDTESKETVEIGIKLRQEMATALLQDMEYKERRYYNVITACREFLEDKPQALDMQAWLTVTRDYRESLKRAWFEINDSLEKSYKATETHYRNLLSNNPIESDDITKLKKILSKTILDKPEQKSLHESLQILLETYYPTESQPMLSLIKLRRLYRAAWLGVTTGTGLERNVISDCIEAIFKQKALAILQKQDISKSPKNLLLLSLLEKTNFEQNGALASNGIGSQEELLSSACALFIENDLGPHWNVIYQNYCEHIKSTTEMLNADELGCLALYWQIGLKIQFAYGEPYITHQTDAAQLQVTLCNPSSVHWNVVCEAEVQFDMTWDNSKIVALILGIENVEYKTYIMEAINNEMAYACRSEECSYIVGVLSAIQEMPQVLLKQGVSLSTADLKATMALSQYFEQGLLRLNAERIYSLKNLIKNIFESSTLASVAEGDAEPSAQNSLFFDYKSPYGGVVTRSRRVGTIINMRTVPIKPGAAF
jgi:hypothetical protein